MKGSFSASDLSNPHPNLPQVQSRLPVVPVPLKHSETSLSPPLQNPDVVRRTLGRVVDQDYYEQRPMEGLAFNAANYSKKRLIMKNKQKFPSDFFNSTKRKSFSGPDESFTQRQNPNAGQQTAFKLAIPEGAKETESSFQTVFGFSHSDLRCTHETPKFSSEAFGNTHGDELHLARLRALQNGQFPKDMYVPTNALESIRKLDFSRVKTAFVPNSRTLGSLTERISGNIAQVSKKMDMYGRKMGDEMRIGSPDIFPDIERAMQPELFSKQSSPEQKSRQLYHEANNKSVQTAPEKKKRNIVLSNKMLTDVALIRKRSDNEPSKEIQSALPRIKHSVDVMDQSAASSRTKLPGMQSQNYFRYEDAAVKCFDLRNKQGEGSEERKSPSDSPLPSVHRNRNIDRNSRKIKPYQIVTQVSSTTIKHETTSICKTSREVISQFRGNIDQDDRSLMGRKHTSLDNKVEKFYGPVNLKYKDAKRNEEDQEKAKVKAHKRYLSMDIDHILMKNSKRKESVNESSRMGTAQRHSRSVMRQRGVKEHKKHISMEIKKDIVETYKMYNDIGNRSRTASQQNEREEKSRGNSLRRQASVNDKNKLSPRDIGTPQRKKSDRSDQEEETKDDKQTNENKEGENLKSGNFLAVNSFEARMRGFTFAKIDFGSAGNLEDSRALNSSAEKK